MGPRLPSYLIGLALTLTGIGGVLAWSYSSGYNKRELMCKAEVADVERQRAAAERAAREERDRGRAAADKLSRQLLEQQSTIASMRERIDRAIAANTSSSRRAMDESLVRLLNQLSPIRERVIPEAGPASPRADAENGATAGDRSGPAGRGASERSVATALAQARSGYALCVNQLNSLIDWAGTVTK
jgi:hypothetical protein